MLSNVLRTAIRPSIVARGARSTTVVARYASGHAQETFESLSERHVQFFKGTEDLFEVQRLQ